MSELPKGWGSATVKDLAGTAGIFVDGDWVESKDQDPNGDIRLLQLADIGDGVFLDKSDRWINADAFTRLRCTELATGDVLIARMPDPLGRACLMPPLEQRCVTVVDVAALRVDSQVADNRWVMHTVNAPQLRAEISAQASGTTRKRISRGNLGGLQIPLPPEAEQKRIADKLDTVLTRVDVVNTRLARVAPILKRFRQSVLVAATSGRLTEDWRLMNGVSDPQVLTLGQLIKVSSGDGLTAKEMKPEGGVPVYGGNGINGHHNQSNVSEPTIVIGRVGFYCGSVHLAPSIAWITDNALRVKFDPTTLDRKYLYFALQGTDLRQNMSSTAQPVISGQKIYPLSFNLPTLPEQTEIVRRVETLFSFADRLDARVQTAQTAADRLTPSLLAKAFRGELVPQDPNDEPASELLKRLAAAPATLTRKRRSKTTS